MYAIIDIETTGGSHRYDRITELAILLHDGIAVTGSYTTLINPERYIPPHIVALTGITNEMVADAPRFCEIAKHLVEITTDCIFVAHNASFDYNFIRAEFKNLGYTYQRDCLCTVKLSRKLLPGLPSYSLGNLCEEYHIENLGRHRAMGDAMATACLFEILFNINASSGLFGEFTNNLASLSPALDRQLLAKLPEETGVYYFLNDRGDIIYIGKSRNIRSRVHSHLGQSKSKRASSMAQEIANISYTATGSELIALLLESAEIKRHQPQFNRRQRRSLYRYGVYTSINSHGYRIYHIEGTSDATGKPILSFQSKNDALDWLHQAVEKFQLCQKMCGLYKGLNGCYSYQLMQCNGACTGEEAPDAYNFRADMLLRESDYARPDMVIVEEGRIPGEQAFVVVRNNILIGYGYLDGDTAVNSTEGLNNYVTPCTDNRETRQIINTYLRTNKQVKIHTFSTVQDESSHYYHW